jgi:hypothetical protein
MKVSLKVQKKGMGSMNKKGKFGGFEFWSSGGKYINLKNCLLKRGKFWKSMKNVDFHMICLA